MITHIVFFKLKENNRENIDKAKEVLLSMQGQISQLLSLEVGVDVLHSARSYDIALVSKFNSLEELEQYRVHPVHEKIAKYMVEVSESIASVDYQTDYKEIV